MVAVSSDGRKLVLDGTEVRFDSDIQDTLTIGNRVFVLIKSVREGRTDNENNVVCVDADGTIRWVIDAPQRDSNTGAASYNAILEEDGRLYAHNWNTYKYEVDVDDGSVTEIKKAGK